MPPKVKHSLSVLESKLYAVLQKHHEKLEELKHVYYESKICFSDVEQKLKRLADSGEGMRNILCEVDKKYIESAVTYKRRPVSIFMGQRNCGKSSLVNEVLRKSCLPTHENPCTARMVRMTYGSTPMASLIDKDGSVTKEVSCKRQKVPSELVNLSEERRREITEVRKLVLAEIDLPILQCGVDFIDSPGFGENMILDQVIDEFIQDDIEPVIVYVINGKEMLRTQDMEAIRHLKQTFPQIPIIFVLNKTDIDIEALEHDLGDISDDDDEGEIKKEEAIERSIKEQKRLINERVLAIFEKLKKPCPDSDLTFLRQGAKFGSCDYFHTVSSLGFRRARLAKDTGPAERDNHIDSFLSFEKSFVNVLNQNLVAMDEKLVTCITEYLQGMSSVMGRAHCGIREAVENLPLLTSVANESELKMKNLLNKFITTSLGDKKLFEKAVKEKEFKELLSYLWRQIREASTDMVRFMCSANSISLVECFGIDEEDLQLEIAPGSLMEKSVQRLWFVTEARNLAVSKLSEMVHAYVVAESTTAINQLLNLLLECQKTLRDPYIKMLLDRAYYCINSANPSNKGCGSFSTMMISTAAFGMHKSIHKGILNGIGEELKKLYKGSDLKKLVPGSMSMTISRKRWHELFADNLIGYLIRNSRRISKLICDHASKEIELMHVVFVTHIRRLEALADDFKKQGRDELLEIGKQFRPRINLLTLRAHALRCQFSRGPIFLGEKVNTGKDGSVHRCSDDRCGWCFDSVYHRQVVARVVHLDTMTDDKRARYVRDLVYTIELADDCQDNPYLVRFYGVLMPGPSTVHILMEEMHMDLLSWLEAMPRSMSKRIRVALHVAKGVKALHERQIVFLDIKPTSVLIGRTGDAKLNICKPESAMAATPLGVPFHLHKSVYFAYETGYHSLYCDIYAMGMLLWVLCEGSGTASPFPGCRDHKEMWTMQELGQIPCNPAGTPRMCWELMEKCWKGPEKLTINDVISVLEKELDVWF